MPAHELTKTTPMDFDPVVTEPTPVEGPTVPNAKLRYIIVPEEDIKAYITGGEFQDKNFKCESKYNLLGLSAVEISDSLLETIRPQLGRSFEEITKDEFYFGTVHFAEIRDTVKVLKTGDGVIWDWTPAIPDEHWKQAIDFSQEMKDFTLSFMKKYAKEIIENEYSKKLKFIKNVSELEAAT